MKIISGSNNNAPIFIGCDLGSDQGGNEYYSIQFGRSFLKEDKDVPKGYEEGYGLNLQSAYYLSFYKGKARSSEPATTVFKGHARDYIFYDQEKGVSCSNVLELPTETEIKKFNKYPNPVSPSTHFPIMAQFFV